MSNEVEEVPFTQIDKLVRAVQLGDVAFVETALTVHNVSPDSKDSQNCSLLHWAAINNRVHVAELLIAHHANVNIIGGEGEEIPLQWAARYAQCLPMLSLLIQKGSNVHHKSKEGYNSVYFAVMAGHLHNAFLLLGAGAGSPDVIASDGDTPLHWLIKHRDFEKDYNAIDLVRLLVAFGADVRIGDKEGDTPLMSLATNSRTRWFPEDIGFLLHQAGHQNSLETQCMTFGVQNHHGDSAWVIAWKTQNLRMLRLLWDLWQYNHLPQFLPILVRIIIIFSLLLFIQYMGYLRGICLWLFVFAISVTVDQGSLSSIDSSRAICGTAWGIIFLAGSMYQWYLGSYFSWWLQLLHGSVWCSICVALWQCMVTPPNSAVSMSRRHFPVFSPQQCIPITNPATTASNKSPEHSRPVTETQRRDYWANLVPRLLMAPPVMNTKKDIVGSSFRFCTTCLIEKPSNTVHCRSCNVCVVGLDHHCPFVNTCVGRGNRRLFVWFTFIASLGCGLMSFWSLYLTTTQLCPFPRLLSNNHHILALLASQSCVLFSHRHQYFALGAATYVALVSSILIGSLCYAQCRMIMQETTTFEAMKHKNFGHAETQGCTNRRAWKNLQLFVLTGQYRVAEAPTSSSAMPTSTEAAAVVAGGEGEPEVVACRVFDSLSSSSSTTNEASMTGDAWGRAQQLWRFGQEQLGNAVEDIASYVRRLAHGHHHQHHPAHPCCSHNHNNNNNNYQQQQQYARQHDSSGFSGYVQGIAAGGGLLGPRRRTAAAGTVGGSDTVIVNSAEGDSSGNNAEHQV